MLNLNVCIYMAEITEQVRRPRNKMNYSDAKMALNRNQRQYIFDVTSVVLIKVSPVEGAAYPLQKVGAYFSCCKANFSYVSDQKRRKCMYSITKHFRFYIM